MTHALAVLENLSAKQQTIPLSAGQLRQLTQVLAEHGDGQAGKRASEALTQALAAAASGG